MSTTRFRTRSRVKVLLSTMALTVASSCKPTSEATPSLEAKEHSAEATPHFAIKDVKPSKFKASEGGSKDEALVAECAKWTLTKEQARRFFQISTSYEENPYSEFYQLPCLIEGVVEAEGKTWEFTINAGATAVLKSGKEIRYFGCSAPACEPLVLMMPDGMEP